MKARLECKRGFRATRRIKSLWTRGPKVHSIVAEGNALGGAQQMSSRPERAIQKRVRPGLPLQGENVSVSFSEGVALGYDGSGRWPVGILILPLELSRLRFIIVEFHVR